MSFGISRGRSFSCHRYTNLNSKAQEFCIRCVVRDGSKDTLELVLDACTPCLGTEGLLWYRVFLHQDEISVSLCLKAWSSIYFRVSRSRGAYILFLLQNQRVDHAR